MLELGLTLFIIAMTVMLLRGWVGKEPATWAAPLIAVAASLLRLYVHVERLR